MLSRFDLFLVVRNQLGERALVRRALALEAVMEDLARATGADAELWGLAGLGADIDASLAAGNPERRGEIAAQLLLAEGAPAEVAGAVRAHHAGRVEDLPALAVGLVAARTLVALLDEWDDPRMLEHHLLRGEKRQDSEMLRALGAIRKLGLDPLRAAELALAARERSRP